MRKKTYIDHNLAFSLFCIAIAVSMIFFHSFIPLVVGAIMVILIRV